MGYLINKVFLPYPAHAEGVELLVEELDAQLAGEERHVLDDGQADAPFVVFGQLDDGRQQ